MKMACIVAGIICVLLAPTQLLAAITIDSTFLFGDHIYIVKTGWEEISVVGGAETNPAPDEDPGGDGYKVYMWNTPVPGNHNGYTANGDVKLIYLPGWGNTFYESFSISSDWENRDIWFWVDDNLDEDLNRGETSVSRTIPSESLLVDGLPLVTNVSTSGGIHPTIYWEYDNSDGRVDYFRVRIFGVDDNGTPQIGAGPLYDRYLPLEDDGTYEFYYDGDLFETYPELAIGIEARDNLEGYGLINRSRYVVNHVVPIPSSLLLLGGGLVSLLGILRRRERTH